MGRVPGIPPDISILVGESDDESVDFQGVPYVRTNSYQVNSCLFGLRWVDGLKQAIGQYNTWFVVGQNVFCPLGTILRKRML